VLLACRTRTSFGGDARQIVSSVAPVCDSEHRQGGRDHRLGFRPRRAADMA
jgi:hypothetical protein